MRLQLEQRTDLALRALRLLNGREQNMRAREMAPLLGTTPQYLPQVLAPYVAAGWLNSEPGPKGGYRLATDLSRRTMLELIEASEGPIANGVCVLKGGPCGQAENCAIHDPWQEARTALVERLDQISVVETTKKERDDV